MADNVRLRKEAEEALRREGDCDDNELRQQRKLQGKGGERGRWTWREEGEEVCLVVLVIVISIIHSNNTYFIDSNT